jgi:hypothetical protein
MLFTSGVSECTVTSKITNTTEINPKDVFFMHSKNIHDLKRSLVWQHRVMPSV